jgi:hypothetical protein
MRSLLRPLVIARSHVVVVISFFVFSLVAKADTFSGSVGFSDLSSPTNNFFNLSGVPSSPSFSFAGTVGAVYTDKITIDTTQLSAVTNANQDIIDISINFANPGFMGTSFAGVGTILTFNRQCCLLGTNWSSNTETVSFTDGSSLLITVPDITLLTLGPATQSLTFTVLTDATITGGPGGGPGVTPEPSSLVLLGTGVLGLAGTMRRRFARDTTRS